MSAKWKTVRVFISSTFRDMQAERDYLVKRIFPDLRQRLEKHHIHLIDIDLRWGVTKEQADNDQALDLCLHQIETCRPFFIGILGERYGWVPNEFSIDALSKYGWIQYHTGKSVTELEIVHGVLNVPRMHDHAFFYFRDPAVSKGLPAEIRRVLEESPTDDELEKRTKTEADQCVEDRRQKLAELKNLIRDAKLPVPPVEDYACKYSGLRINWRLARMELNEADQQALQEVAEDGIVDPNEYSGLDARLRDLVYKYGAPYLTNLEEFGSCVRDQLWEAIRREHGLDDAEPQSLDAVEPLVEEADYHERFMESRLRVFVGREGIQQSLITFAEGDATVPCLVTGPSGSGKSAVLAKFASDYQKFRTDVLVIPHFIGASPNSSSLRQMLHRFCSILQRACQFQEEIPTDTNSLVKLFQTFVAGVTPDCPLLFVIDALNQLDEVDDAQSLAWLPVTCPAHVKIITSCIDDGARHDAVLVAFEHRRAQRVAIEPLTDVERFEIVCRIPSLSAKTLDELQIGQLLTNPATKNPLFLLVALEELRGFGSFEQLDRRIAHLPRPCEQEPSWKKWLAQIRQQANQFSGGAHRGARLKRLDAIEETIQASNPVEDPLESIFQQVIERFTYEVGRDKTRILLAQLASSRYGLTELELRQVVAPEVNDNDLYYVLRQLRPYTLKRGDLVDFSHRAMAKAVRSRYLDEPHVCREAHSRLADYFKKLASQVKTGQQSFPLSLHEQDSIAKRVVDELPWQQQHAMQWPDLKDTLVNLDLFHAMWVQGRKYEWIGYWNKLPDGYSAEECLGEALDERIAAQGKTRFIANLTDHIAWFLRDMYKFQAAIPFQHRALDQFKQLYGPTHANIGAMLNNLAACHSALLEFDRAIPLLQESLAITERQVGRDHYNYGAHLYNLGDAYRNKGDFAHAAEHYRAAATVFGKLGAARESYGRALIQHGMCLNHQGKVAAAYKDCKQGLAVLQDALGSKHPSVSECLCYLGEQLRALNRYDESEKLLLEAKDNLLKSLGEHDYRYGLCMHNLGKLYQSIERPGDSLLCFRQALESIQDASPLDSLSCVSNMSAVCQSAEDVADVKRRTERLQSVLTQKLGGENEHVALTYQVLTEVCGRLEAFDEALRHADKAIEIFKKIGNDSADLGDCILNAAAIRMKLGMHSEARAAAKEAIAWLSSHDPPDQVKISTGHQLLAKIAVSSGDTKSAVVELKEARSCLAGLAGQETALRNCLFDQVQFLARIGEQLEAAEVLATLWPLLDNKLRFWVGMTDLLSPALELLVKSKERTGGDQKELLSLYEQLLIGRRRQRNDAERTRVLQGMTQILSKLQPSDNCRLFACVQELGQLLFRMGKYQDAIPILKLGLKIQQEAYSQAKDLGKSDPERLRELQRSYFLGADNIHFPDDAVDKRIRFLNYLTLACEMVGDLGLALQYAQHLYHDLEEAKGADHPDTIAGVELLARQKRLAKQFDESLRLYDEARQRRINSKETMTAEIAANHVGTAECLNEIGVVFYGMRDYENACVQFAQAVNHRKLAGAVDKNLLITLKNLANSHEALGQIADAINCLERCIALAPSVSNDDTSTLEIRLRDLRARLDNRASDGSK